MDRPMLAFEPMSCAILCALCRPKYLATAPRMRVWLRRSSESVREALLEEYTALWQDPHADQGLLFVSVALLALLAAMHFRGRLGLLHQRNTSQAINIFKTD